MRFFKKNITSPFDYRTLYKYLPDRYRLKVGLALGSGGARGLTHLGVISALTSAGVKIDFVSGTSVGALVGAFLAAGKLDDLIAFTAPLTLKESLKMADIMFPTSGLIEGKKIEQFLRKHLGTVKIEDLPVPFACVATNFYTGQEVLINRGDLVTAVRASISIPGVFKPVAADGMLLVDGGVVNPVPVQVVRDLGAEFIIAVDISPEIANKMTVQHPIIDPGQGSGKSRKGEARLPNIFDIIMGSIMIMESQIVDMRMKTELPDVIISPSVSDIGTYDFHRYREGVERGESAAGQVISQIRKYIGLYRNISQQKSGGRRPDGILT
ncbi:MAG: patatin-like phospholipase family protein [Deltaproteobacteria bacterium]|nr:patatin-like phospholipase family protein [Candidatus Zymogenaceae bacterium]